MRLEQIVTLSDAGAGTCVDGHAALNRQSPFPPEPLHRKITEESGYDKPDHRDRDSDSPAQQHGEQDEGWERGRDIGA